MNRAEHLAWAKQRALEYCVQGDLTQAFTSMASDLRKHEELANHLGLELGFLMLAGGHLNSSEKMRNFIEGFN